MINFLILYKIWGWYNEHRNAALINEVYCILEHMFPFRKWFSLNFINQITRNFIGSENVDKRNYAELKNKRIKNKVILIWFRNYNKSE